MNTKIFTLAFAFLLSFSGVIKAQVSSAGNISASLEGSNYFLDASLSQKLTSGNQGRVLGFPQTDLSKFVFDPSIVEDEKVATNYFDGVIVYNTAVTGEKRPDNSTIGNTAEGKSTPLSRGFYYFSNPGMGDDYKTVGQWKVLGGGGSFTEGNENITNIIVDGKPVYAQTGSFTVGASSTTGTITSQLQNDATIGSIYRITIFTMTGATSDYYSASVYSFDAQGKKLITGSPSMSVVYPAGDYKFMIEYFKKP